MSVGGVGAQGETPVRGSKKEGLTTIPSKVLANVPEPRVSCLTRDTHACEELQRPFWLQARPHTCLRIPPPLQMKL